MLVVAIDWCWNMAGGVPRQWGVGGWGGHRRTPRSRGAWPFRLYYLLLSFPSNTHAHCTALARQLGIDGKRERGLEGCCVGGAGRGAEQSVRLLDAGPHVERRMSAGERAAR